MTEKERTRDDARPRKLSRREFLKAAAAAGLLAGCSPLGGSPTPTDVPEEASPTPEVGSGTEAAPPGVTSKVVHAHHAGVWDGEELAPEALRQMLDTSIAELTGLEDAAEAWASLFAPDERIAIKVNTIDGSSYWTHVPLVMAIAGCLQEAGIPAEQIVVFDRRTDELEKAGYPVNQDGPGVRCYGTDGAYTGDWMLATLNDLSIVERPIRFSDVLLGCDALINVPILKAHGMTGISFALKNHYGSFDKPGNFHTGIDQSMPALNGLEPIKDRTRLIVGDVLRVVEQDWSRALPGDSILMSFDPIAHDTIGVQVFEETYEAATGRSTSASFIAGLALQIGADMGLGANDLESIDLVEVDLA